MLGNRISAGEMRALLLMIATGVIKESYQEIKCFGLSWLCAEEQREKQLNDNRP